MYFSCNNVYHGTVEAELTLVPTKILFAALLTASAWLVEIGGNVLRAGTSEVNGFVVN